jgi:ABC-type transport system involved in cytochrome c biogenesis permease subunit
MTNQKSNSMRNPDAISAIACAAALLTALGFYFIFYAPVIRAGVRADVLPAKEILWLEIHIAAYWISYVLYFMGFLLAVLCLWRKATTRFPWIEAVTLLATVLAVIGLITGILFSKPAWNAWWVWDVKHVFVLFNTFVLIGISLMIPFGRFFSKKINHNLVSAVLLFVAVDICVESLLIGFMRNIHPQWFLNMFFQ